MVSKKYVPVSLVIPTCNRHDDLLNTVLSYLSSSVLPSQFIIVDQSDESELVATGKMIESLLLQYNCSLKFIVCKDKSLTKARNIGLKEASNNIVIFSDDDIEVCGETIFETYSLMSSSEYAMCGALDKNTSLASTPLKVFASCMLGRKEWGQRHIGCVTKSVYGSYPYEELRGEVDSRWAMGYFFSIKKDLAFEHGLLFDEKLSAYSYAEDLDFTYRYWKIAFSKKLRCVISPRIEVRHLASLKNRLPTQTMFIKECVNRLYLSYKLFPKQFSSRVAYYYSNFCTALRFIFKKNYFKMWVKANLIALKHKKELSKGKIDDLTYL